MSPTGFADAWLESGRKPKASRLRCRSIQIRGGMIGGGALSWTHSKTRRASASRPFAALASVPNPHEFPITAAFDTFVKQFFAADLPCLSWFPRQASERPRRRWFSVGLHNGVSASVPWLEGPRAAAGLVRLVLPDWSLHSPISTDIEKEISPRAHESFCEQEDGFTRPR